LTEEMRNKTGNISRTIHLSGSALLLAVVISSLLAIVGVLFVMVARIDKIASSSVSDNQELKNAIDTAAAQISQQLTLDVPGITSSAKQNYYDYPDVNNIWLADTEPYQFNNEYYWRQISDIFGSLNGYTRNVKIIIVGEYDPVTDFNNLTTTADADGDGIGDSKWIRLNNISTRRGTPIYAAVRIIDNAAMLNANTGYKLDTSDPNADIFYTAGSQQLNINLLALTARPGNSPASGAESDLLEARANYGVNLNPQDLHSYLNNVIWKYGEPNGPYTPFDVSDELEMRYRYILNNTHVDTRLENWSSEFRNATLSIPVNTSGQALDTWYKRTHSETNIDPNYSYRHITTIYSMDRIINPAGNKMVNINHADANSLFTAIRAGMQEPNAAAADALAAQLAVNIIDYRDQDSTITTFTHNGKTYYGLEAQPFISEIYFHAGEAPVIGAIAFAIELYNPFDVDIPLSDFKIELRTDSGTVAKTISLSPYVIGKRDRFVITSGSTSLPTGKFKAEPNMVMAEFTTITTGFPPVTQHIVTKRYNVYLLRNTPAQIYMDKQLTQDSWFGNWPGSPEFSRSFRRADTNWNVIYQNVILDSNSLNNLGLPNGISGTRKNYNISNPNGSFLTVGDITRVLTTGPGTDPNGMLGIKLNSEPNEYQVRIDLLNPKFTNIFQYLTAIDPADYGQPAAETRIKGRININTAPWFVIAQLPGMTYDVAKAIIDNRDTNGPYGSIGQIMRVAGMQKYGQDKADLNGYPDLTSSDGAVDDFEERDIILSRISNLATVRSDIFTSYILVRLGTDGPQKRVIAVFDRSRTSVAGDKVSILAIQSVPDPR
jgi:hypothetical protein